MTPCAYCGEDIARNGTTLEAELFIEDRTYAIRPSFCSWQHAEAWFGQPPPDITAWQRTKRKVKQPRAEGGVVVWAILVALVVLVLVTVITLTSTLN